jgi:hypothetical protein
MLKQYQHLMNDDDDDDNDNQGIATIKKKKMNYWKKNKAAYLS